MVPARINLSSVQIDLTVAIETCTIHHSLTLYPPTMILLRPISATLCATALFVLLFGQNARAQSIDNYPSKPLRIVVTVPPGGAADFVARTVGQRLGEALGQTVIVENRAGASGTIAADAVAKANPDGYTILQNSITTHGIGPHILPKLPYDSFGDLAPVVLLSRLPLIMVINASVPAANVRDFIALSRARPGQLTFASSGNGGAPHMAAELFKGVTGAALTHVPYRGSGPAVADLISGQVNVMFDGAPALLQHVRSGKLRPLAAASSARNRLLPDTPTFSELGFNGVEVSLWYGLMVPAATPRAIINRLNAETNKILATADIRDRFAAQGAEPGAGSPEDFARYMSEEFSRWGRVIKQSGIKAD